jgi:Amt family ammonium transporter
MGKEFGLGHGHVDFAGSSVVHLVGGAAGLAGAIVIGPRLGKYTKSGESNAFPGHDIPMALAGTFILAFGWFGFNPGSTLAAIGNRFAEVVLVTNLAAAAGVLAALAVMYRRTKTYDVGMAGNGAIAALVAITAPSGYVEFWAAPIIGAVAGVIVVYGVILIEKVLDDPVGALSAHGLAGIWGTLSCGLFTSPRLAELNGVGDPGLWYSGSFHQLGAQALGVGTAFAIVFVVSYAMFFAMKHSIGLRVTAEEEDAGLDIAETGMYGYPEQFIPPSDLIGSGLPATGGAPHRAPAGVTATAMTGEATA